MEQHLQSNININRFFSLRSDGYGMRMSTKTIFRFKEMHINIFTIGI